MNNITTADKILEFIEYLSNVSVNLPNSYHILNPFKGTDSIQTKKISKQFYTKYFNDVNKRIMILGSSPARRGTAITGIPFEDAQHLFKETGIEIDNFHINNASSNFLYDVIERFGGAQKFYSKFYLNFVCPLGISKTNEKGNDVNSNYYDNKELQHSLDQFILNSLKKQLGFNIDTTVCFCIGSGENFKYLDELNKKHKFFDKIIPLEHPRFIMQYNSKDKEIYLQKYLQALNYKQANQQNEGEFYEKQQSIHHSF